MLGLRRQRSARQQPSGPADQGTVPHPRCQAEYRLGFVPVERSRRLRLGFAVALGLFAVLELVLHAWVIAGLALVWMVLVLVQDRLKRTRP